MHTAALQRHFKSPFTKVSPTEEEEENTGALFEGSHFPDEDCDVERAT